VGDQLVGKEFLRLVREVSRVSVAELINLPFDGFADGGMSVAQAAYSRTSRGIQITLTARIVKEQPFAAYGHRKSSSSISAEDVTHCGRTIMPASLAPSTTGGERVERDRLPRQ
jgi:hypothetical protein